MQLTQKTLKILKNFSAINQGLLIRPGNVQSTCTKAHNVYARATLDESFEKEFALYDLRKFLGVLSMFEDPELKFDDKFVIVSSGRRKIKYFYAERSTIDFPPDKIPNLPPTVGQFNLPQQVLMNALKATGVLGLSEVLFKGDGDQVEIQGIDTQDPTKNTFTETLDPTFVTTNGEFRAVVKTDCLKMLPSDYQTIVTERCLVFESSDVYYLVAINI